MSTPFGSARSERVRVDDADARVRERDPLEDARDRRTGGARHVEVWRALGQIKGRVHLLLVQRLARRGERRVAPEVKAVLRHALERVHRLHV